MKTGLKVSFACPPTGYKEKGSVLLGIIEVRFAGKRVLVNGGNDVTYPGRTFYPWLPSF